MTICAEKRWPYPLPIKNGEVELVDHEIGIKYVIPVRQIKGLGTADADSLVELNDYHRQILRVLVTTNEQASFTANQILQWVETWRTRNNIPGEFKQANWRRPISELARKCILYKAGGNPPKYSLDHVRAQECISTGRFGPQDSTFEMEKLTTA